MSPLIHVPVDSKIDDTCRMPLAIAPPRMFSRLATQRSWFTIHPTPSHVQWARPGSESPRVGEETLTLLEIKARASHGAGGDSVLTRHQIAPETKRIIRNELGALGITRATLFADLGGLAKSLMPELERRFPVVT